MRLTFLWKRVLTYVPSVFLGLLIAVPVFSLVWFVLFTDTFTVQTVTVVDARPQTVEQIMGVAQRMQGKNILFLQTDILEQQILTELAQVRIVHAARKLPGTLKLVIQEKTPQALLLASSTYYFLDEGGTAYEEARLDTLPGVVLPTLKVSGGEATVTIGTQVVEPAFIQFVEHVQTELPNLVAAQVVEIRIPSLSAREVHFSLSNNWEVRFDSTRGAQSQLNVLRQLITSTIPPAEQQTLEYIDLRIPQRVYYKSRGKAATPAATATPSPRPDAETPPDTSPRESAPTEAEAQGE
ncbi:MAG: FtsQ-type POTRA domain-containing protein [Patescibacteria group bacterium]